MKNDEYTLRVLPKLPDAPAARLDMLLDMWAPMTYDECGCPLGRDESAGVITREQLLELLDSA
jgi:hypothetical protein